MPRSPQKVNSWRALTLLVVLTAFVSLMLVQAGAQGRRAPSSQSNASSARPQTGRKNIASVRVVDTSDGSRVTITSDVPLNDYEAYWGGDRFFVIIPNAEITYQNVQTLQASLRGRGFQDVRIERKGNDLVFSFRMQSGFRARPEQKFNRLDIILTAPPGSIVTRNENRNTQPTRPQGGGGGGGGNRVITGGELGNTSNRPTTSGGAGTTTGGGGGSTIASSGGGGGSRRIGRTRGSRSGGSGYSGGGSDRGGGTPLNIPLPSDIQAPTPTPTATSPANGNAAANTSASPSTSPGAGQGTTAQTNTSPTTTVSPTPEQIARNEPPVTAPPSTTTTNTPPAPAATTGFAAAVREYWLPLLIGLLVLGAIVLLMASRSRAGAGEGRDGRERLQTKKQETIKEKPASRTGAAVAGAAGAAAVAAMAKESRAKAAPTKETPRAEETKAVEPTTPAVGMERTSSEVKSLLDGKDYDEAVISSTNPDTRQIVSTELLAALASRNPERRLRAREAFINHGFFDEATSKLRTSTTAAERISAARALGLTQDNSATKHLVAALEDDDPEVRRASVNALAELRDPSAIGPLNALLEREKNRKVPHSLIRRAIEASATIDLPEAAAQSTTPAAATAKDATATGADKKDKDDDDREVFEI